ncbi:citrate/2-methylcitrate synthase [uncultured Microbacterium sp.]|uniref:citrate/2-methylcitrate synthase n=1 Tax=uncultured Microbacterium sp. TaxID=191216 RepID=UPI0025D3A990|nr:citrate/2-methylcitrate synthase [uncultured Microbacterium sp.]
MEALTAAQTAARLGVRTETLYAYVSRGLISRERGAHGSLFDPLEVERFARTRRRATSPSHGAAPSAGADGSPLAVIDTDIALIEDGELWIRGVPIDELVARAGDQPRFDAVVRWLFARTDAPSDVALPLERPESAAALRVVAALPPAAGAFSRLLAAVAALAADDPERYDLRTEAVARVAPRLVAGLVDALPTVGVEQDVSEGTTSTRVAGVEHVAARLWPRLTALPASPDRVRVLDAALVLLVDHDMAASTLAARAAASARAHPYAVVAAGFGALDSALHGAVSAAVHALLRQVQDGADPAAAVATATRLGGAGIPGFGQLLYPEGDPRARLLLRLMRETGDPRAHAALGLGERVAAVVRARTGLHPTVDLALAVMALAWNMPADAGETVFAVARAAGWCAHAQDEYGRAPLRLRPIGHYVGPDAADLQRPGRNAR